MRAMKLRLAQIAMGGLMLGWLQAAGAIDFSSIWGGLLAALLNIIVVIFLGGDLSSLQGQFSGGL